MTHIYGTLAIVLQYVEPKYWCVFEGHSQTFREFLSFPRPASIPVSRVFGAHLFLNTAK